MILFKVYLNKDDISNYFSSKKLVKSVYASKKSCPFKEGETFLNI